MHHDSVGAPIQALCDGFLDVIAIRLEGAAVEKTGEICKFTVHGQAICHVYHRRDKLDVYIRWDPDRADELVELARHLDLSFRLRSSFEKNWARRWPIHFHIKSHSELARFESIVLMSADWLGFHVNAYSGGAFELDRARIGIWPEGGVRTLLVNGYERSPSARAACLNHYGTSCSVCGFDFEARYGEIGRGFIHVHHLVPIASVGQSYLVDPIRDLCPVCPNCHEMLHRREPPYSIEELRCLVR